MTDTTWQEQASCATGDPELFFSNDPDDMAAALRFCDGCPLVAACLTFAIDTGTRHGVFGGTTERQRHRLITRTVTRKRECVHGHQYVAGSYTIRTNGSRSCKACHNRRDREQYIKRQAAKAAAT